LNSRRTSRTGAAVSEIKDVVPLISRCVLITICFMIRFKMPLIFIPITACFYLRCWWRYYSACHIVNYNYKNYIMLELSKLTELEWTAEGFFPGIFFFFLSQNSERPWNLFSLLCGRIGNYFQVWRSIALRAATCSTEDVWISTSFCSHDFEGLHVISGLVLQFSCKWHLSRKQVLGTIYQWISSAVQFMVHEVPVYWFWYKLLDILRPSCVTL
jgi:hypothetical protein